MYFQNSNFKQKENEKTANPAETCVQSCRREKIFLTQNCRCEFIKNLLTEKHKENM